MNNKLISRVLISVALCGVLGLASCSDDNEDSRFTLRLNQTPIEYDADGVWAGVATNNSIFSQNMLFSHTGEIGAWGLVQTGFTPARCTVTDLVQPLSDRQFCVISGGGTAGEGTPYMAAYWNSSENAGTPAEARSCRVTFSKDAVSAPLPFTPLHVYVNNNCYTYYDMLNGSNFSKKFEAGDYLLLNAWGVHTDGSVSKQTFPLANCEGNPDSWFVTDWTLFDLSGLGEVTELYFTMTSSDKGQFGINTPTYFCIDGLTIAGKLSD